jgi:chromosomal replication initiation ATPase DnaA
VNIKEIIADAARRFSVQPSEILSPTRQRRVVRVRQWIMTEASSRGYSLNQIGMALGRDHKTVHHGIAAELQRRREAAIQ